MTAYGAASGVASTFTLDTGVTESGTFVTSMVQLNHSRMGAAVPVAISMKNASDVTETYAIS